jgi:two-component system, OmpR family, sensor histidine kinase TctE
VSRRAPSLKARLIIKPLLLQFLTVAAAAIGIILFFVNSTVDGMYTDETLVKVAADAIRRDAKGETVVTITPGLAKLRKESPDIWFVARMQDGRRVGFGQVPREVSSLVANLDRFSSADLRGRDAPYALSAIVRPATGPAGAMTIITHGRVQPFTVLITMASNFVAFGIFIALALVSVIATPWIVKRALAGVLKTAEEAERIDVDRRGIRLSEDKVPREIAPLVRAVNEALGRLDEGYERQHRFIASAAHELRTPIAILRMKIDAATDPAVRALSGDVSRLATLSEQLLDLHRLDNGAPTDRIDLPALARRVVADLAPVLIASDKTIEVLVDRAAPITGNAGSIERVLTNLVQNAVEHGGNDVRVRIDGPAFEVEDNGPGIPAAEHDRVFEPFHRLRPRASGTGLGLNLVRQVMEHHRGSVAIVDAPAGGLIVRAEFPAA